MKTKKLQYQTELKRKKPTQKFKAYFDDDSSEEFDSKRRKDVGRRMHMQKTLKDLFSENER